MSPLIVALLLLAGVLAYSFIEYAHHRWGGHVGSMGARLLDSHQYHHRDPPEGGVTYPEKLRQRAPLVLGASLVIGGLLALVVGLANAGVVLAGMILGYLYSEWFHHRMHHRLPRSRLAGWMWRHHYIHHFVDPTVNYGFTSPLWDWILRTRREIPEIEVPGKLVPEWPQPRYGIALRASSRS